MRQVPLIIEPDHDDPSFAAVMVDATVAGRPYRLVLDTGAARTQLDADRYTCGLSLTGEDRSSSAFGGRVTEEIVTITDLAVGPLRVRGDGLGVVGAEHAGIVGGGLLVQFDGAGQVAGCPVGAGQVGAGVEGVGMVWAEDALIVREVALMQVQGAVLVMLHRVEVGEVGPRHQSFRVVLRGFAVLSGNTPLHAQNVTKSLRPG